MVAPVIPNVTSPLGIVLVDPTTGLAYVAGSNSPGTGVTSVGGFSSFAPAAGATNNANPGSGFPALLGRIDVDTTAGNANWTGLLAGVDGQIVIIRNTGANNLVLNNQNASSTAANRFSAAADFTLVPGDAVWVVYYGGSVNRWVIVP